MTGKHGIKTSYESPIALLLISENEPSDIGPCFSVTVFDNHIKSLLIRGANISLIKLINLSVSQNFFFKMCWRL